jgi:hypothetical protein
MCGRQGRHPNHNAVDIAAGPAPVVELLESTKQLKRPEVKPNVPRPGWLATSSEIWAEMAPRPAERAAPKSPELAELSGALTDSGIPTLQTSW